MLEAHELKSYRRVLMSRARRAKVTSFAVFDKSVPDGPLAYLRSSPLDALAALTRAHLSYDAGSDIKRAAELAAVRWRSCLRTSGPLREWTIRRDSMAIRTR
jgi:hypothetical protein